MAYYHPDGSQPSAGMVQKVKQVMFVFLLKLLLEEPHDGFFDSPPNPQKKAKAEKQHLTWKKTWAAWKEKGQRLPAVKPAEGTGPENLVSSPEVSMSLKQSRVSTPSNASGIFSLAKEKLKVLNFKCWQRTLTGDDVLHLADLAGEGSNPLGLPFSLGLDGDNALGSGAYTG
jgi:hypothetical protein